jgi:hypothetical protein
MKTKKDYYLDIFGLLVNGKIPDEILDNYINDVGEDSYTPLADYVSNNMRGEIMDWSTAIGIIEAVDHIYHEAIANGNIKNRDMIW